MGELRYIRGMDKDVIDAEFTVVGEEPPRKWWQGWRIRWTPWPMIIAGGLALPALIRALQG